MVDIEIRSARTEDRQAVLAFCTNTWDWGDYIEHVWDQWLTDPRGELFVATSAGHPVGVAHMQMLSETEAWLEGIRIDPQYRKQGIATTINMTMMAEAMQRGATIVRLATDSTNTKSIQLVEHMHHMRRMSAFVPFRASPLTTSDAHSYGIDKTTLASTDDLDEIIDYLNNSNIFPSAGGLYYADFKARAITGELLEKMIQAQQVYLLRRWNRLDGLALAELRQEHNGQRLSIGYIDGTTIESISLIAHDLRSRTYTHPIENIIVYAPDLVLVRDALAGIGYESDGSVFYTYERGLV